MEEITTQVRAHGMEWLSVAGFAPTLRRIDVLRARRVDRLGDWRLVKDNTVRSVLRLPDPQEPGGPGLFLKRYKFRDFSRRLRHLAMPTKPEVEWRACRMLRAIGVPTCDVLAIGLRRKCGLPQEGFLISREIAGVTGLSKFLHQQHDRKALWSVAEELAEMTARLLRNGLYHNDYHGGNLLIRPQTPPGQRLFVVDLHSFRRRLIRRRHVVGMLAMLARSTKAPGVNEATRMQFLRRLLERWRGLQQVGPADLRRWCRRVREAVRRQHRRHMCSRTRRCLKESSLFTIEETERFTVHRRRDFPRQAALAAVALHRKAMQGQTDGVEVFRQGRRTEVTVCPSESVPPRTLNQPAPPDRVRPGRVCVKAFRRQTLRERLKDALRPRSRARVAWVAARGLHVRGIPAAQPMALLESRHKLAGEPDYLITEAIKNEGTLVEFLMNRRPTPTERRRLSRAVARLLVEMADEGVYHPDTKASNILVRRDGSEFRLWLVDLDRARFDTRIGRRRWVKCLARINAALPPGVPVLDRMRCLRECSRGRWSAADSLEVARQVHALSLKRGGPAHRTEGPV